MTTKYNNCYKIENNNINSLDNSTYSYVSRLSTGKIDRGSYKADYIGIKGVAYGEYLNKLQKNILLNDLSNELKKYKIFKQAFIDNQKKSKLKYKTITTNFKDTTNILPAIVISDLSKHKLYSAIRFGETPLKLYKEMNHDPKKRKALNNYLKSLNEKNGLHSSGDSTPSKYDSNNIVDNFFIRDSILVDEVDRYKVSFAKYKFEENYINFPKDVVFEINDVKYNYIPTIYKSNDENIKVEVINTPLLRKTVKQFKISNNTKEFIEIDTIAGYYGEDVVDNILVTKIKLSPMSFKNITVSNFPKKKLLDVKTKKQKINYGFSIGYKMINNNVMKSLYKVNLYTIDNI